MNVTHGASAFQEGNVDESRVTRLFLRGKSARQIGRTLGCAEDDVLNCLVAVRKGWADTWGIPELGECVQTLWLIEELSRGHSNRAALSLSEKRRFNDLVLKASNRRAQAAHLRPRRHTAGAVPYANELRASLKAALLRKAAASSPVRNTPPHDEYDDERRRVSRLAAQGLQVPTIAARAGLTVPAVERHLLTIRSWWIETLGTVEAGEAFAQAKRITESSLDEAMNRGCSTSDCIRLLSQAIASCTSCMKLLEAAIKRRQALRLSEPYRPTEEQIAVAQRALAIAESQGLDVDNMF